MLRGDADYINEGFIHPREIFITMRGLQKVGCSFITIMLKILFSSIFVIS